MVANTNKSKARRNETLQKNRVQKFVIIVTITIIIIIIIIIIMM